MQPHMQKFAQSIEKHQGPIIQTKTEKKSQECHTKKQLNSFNYWTMLTHTWRKHWTREYREYLLLLLAHLLRKCLSLCEHQRRLKLNCLYNSLMVYIGQTSPKAPARYPMTYPIWQSKQFFRGSLKAVPSAAVQIGKWTQQWSNYTMDSLICLSGCG